MLSKRAGWFGVWAWVAVLAALGQPLTPLQIANRDIGAIPAWARPESQPLEQGDASQQYQQQLNNLFNPQQAMQQISQNIQQSLQNQSQPQPCKPNKAAMQARADNE